VRLTPFRASGVKRNGGRRKQWREGLILVTWGEEFRWVEYLRRLIYVGGRRKGTRESEMLNSFNARGSESSSCFSGGGADRAGCMVARSVDE